MTVEDENHATDLLESPRLIGSIEGSMTFFEAHKLPCRLWLRKT